MPGIAGILGGGASDQNRRLVMAMLGTMMHEPSYVSGLHADANLGAYSGWVAHAASFAERESTPQAGRPFALSFSGECFQRDDPRPLLETYERYGDEFVAGLDGSFSGLLIDSQRRRVLLFNDRFGAERIYYHETKAAILFASEAKALLAVLPELRQFDEEGVVQFLTYGSTLAERTLFRGISVMHPGSLWTLDERFPLTKRPYFRPDDWRSQPKLTGAEFRERLQDEFPSALRDRVGSDTAVGISITGGLDTRMIMACLPQTKHRPVCYTFAGIGGETLDVRLGRRVAEVKGLEHRTLRIGPDFIARYGEHVDRTAFITDGCVGALGAHEIYLNSLARQIAPVRVTGNFGSEVLRGVSTFKALDLAADLLEPEMRARVSSFRSSGPVHEENPAIFAAFHEIPSIHFGIPAAARSQVTFRSPFLCNAIVELAIRAPAAETASAGASAALVERHDAALGAIPTDRGVLPNASGSFRLLSRVFSEVTFKLDYWHKEGLPARLTRFEPMFELLSGAALLGLHKYLPYRGWFRQELAEYVRSVFSDERTRRMPWWDARSLDRIVANHLSGRRNYVREINAVLSLESVERGLLLPANDAKGAVWEGQSRSA